ncbi:MAG: hypothetical protein A2096_10455 [Spirochaetes bacterium GWF1_41_5]|nr:MAG: hypothetical protein A2096_10455 [Spirochaetes bacterium GWF1_41_5]HBE01028.1 hypothetical protein [Spirochaetia bacterium]
MVKLTTLLFLILFSGRVWSYTISGAVYFREGGSNKTLSGVPVIASGLANFTNQTSSSGLYTITVVSGFYQVKPVSNLMTAVPESYGLTVSENISNYDFFLVPLEFNISGTVRDQSNRPYKNLHIVLNHDTNRYVLTDSLGNWSIIAGAAVHTLTVTNTELALLFSSTNVDLRTASATNVNFTVIFNGTLAAEKNISFSASRVHNLTADNSINLSFYKSATGTSDCKISLFNVSGKFIREIFTGKIEQGAYACSIDNTEGIKNGIYIIRVAVKIDGVWQNHHSVITVLR